MKNFPTRDHFLRVGTDEVKGETKEQTSHRPWDLILEKYLQKQVYRCQTSAVGPLPQTSIKNSTSTKPVVVGLPRCLVRNRTAFEQIEETEAKSVVRKLCISYSSDDKELVEEAIQGLKAYGYDVFYGLDVETMNGKDWVCPMGDKCKKSKRLY